MSGLPRHACPSAAARAFCPSTGRPQAGAPCGVTSPSPVFAHARLPEFTPSAPQIEGRQTSCAPTDASVGERRGIKACHGCLPSQ